MWSDGKLAINFGWLDDNEHTFQWREKLRRELKESPLEKYIPDTCEGQYPNIPPEAWVPIVDDIIDIMEELLQEEV